MKKNTVLLIVAACSALFGGCASVPMASVSLDSQAKQFQTKPQQANIYINRGGGIGTALVFQTVLDGRIVGSLAPHTFQLLSVAPGHHTITVTGNENSQQENLNAEAGKNYFYNVSVHMGWASGRARIVPVSATEGRKLVTKSKRAETTTYK